MITTPADPVAPGFRGNRPLQGMAGFFAAVWLWGAIAPVDRFDWLLENLLVFIAVGLLIPFYRTRPLSDVSCLMIVLFLALHTVGAHYTYAKVPLGFWLQDALSLDRNHFDRIIHFGFGLLIACPVREALVRHAGAGLWLSVFAAGAVIASSSAIFEILEWVVAVIVDPEAAMAYLGTQGDVFDSQKDSALAVAGGVIGLIATYPLFRTRRGSGAR